MGRPFPEAFREAYGAADDDESEEEEESIYGTVERTVGESIYGTVGSASSGGSAAQPPKTERPNQQVWQQL